MNTYKFAGRTEKLINSILKNGGAKHCDLTISSSYLRHKDNIEDVQMAIKVVDNMCDYDPDFDEDPVREHKITIPRSEMKNYYTDLIMVHKLHVLRLPNNVIDFPNNTFVAIGEYRINDKTHHCEKKLNTIKFADNNEMPGEVNTKIVDSVQNMDKAISSFYQFGRIRPIETIKNDAYLAFKYANDIDESTFKL